MFREARIRRVDVFYLGRPFSGRFSQIGRRGNGDDIGVLGSLQIAEMDLARKYSPPIYTSFE